MRKSNSLIIILFLFLVIDLYGSSKIVLFRNSLSDRYLQSKDEISGNFLKWEQFLLSNHISYDVLDFRNIENIDSLYNYSLYILPFVEAVDPADIKVVEKLIHNDKYFIITGRFAFYESENYKGGDVLSKLIGGDVEYDNKKSAFSGNMVFSAIEHYSYNVISGLKFFVSSNKDIIHLRNVRHSSVYYTDNRNELTSACAFTNNIFYSAVDFSNLPPNQEVIKSYNNIIKNVIAEYTGTPLVWLNSSKTNSNTTVFYDLFLDRVNDKAERLLDTMKNYPLNLFIFQTFKSYKPYLSSSFNICPLVFESDFEWYKKEELIKKTNSLYGDIRKFNKTDINGIAYWGKDFSQRFLDFSKETKTNYIVSNNKSELTSEFERMEQVLHFTQTSNGIAALYSPKKKEADIWRAYEDDYYYVSKLGGIFHLNLIDAINYPAFAFEIKNIFNFINKVKSDVWFATYSEYYDRINKMQNVLIEKSINQERKILSLAITNKNNVEVNTIFINIKLPVTSSRLKVSGSEYSTEYDSKKGIYTIKIDKINPSEIININLNYD